MLLKKFFFLFLLQVFICNFSFSQESWFTARPPMGSYAKLPQNIIHWDNPNKTPMLYFTPNGLLTVGPNVRVYPNSNHQVEVVLCSQTANPNFMFGSANTTIGSAFGQGCYVTTNGGVLWYGTDFMPNEPSSASDPAPIIDKNGVIVFTSVNLSGSVTMYGQYSTNYGVNWSTPYSISSLSSDKNFTGTDDYPASPYYGRSYTVWSNMSQSLPPIVVSYTTNSGVTWSSASTINSPPAGHYSQGADIITGPGGVVYVTWAAPVSNGSFTEDFFGFAKSTNGGTSWIVTENAFDGNGIRTGSFNGWGVRVNSFPRIGVDRSGGNYNGYIYIVTSQINLAPAGGDVDIVMHRSSDGGSTWSAGIRVNQDVMNNGKVQFFPAIRVDESGGINVVYYDNRNFPPVGDSCDTYLSRSIDGGLTWTDIKVSDHRWKPVGIQGSLYYMGDYIGITSGNGKIWPFWFDNKSGSFQAWTAPVTFGPTIITTPLGNTEQSTGTIPVNCVITSYGSGINPSLTKLNYAKNSTSWISVNMTNAGGNNWTANITLSGTGTYNYYITTADSLNRTATSPPGAPANYFSFNSSPDTVKPVIVHTPIENIPKQNWPINLTASVTDNIGIDSSWVRWYKNSIANTKTFKLVNTNGNTYTALFNSLNSEVNPGDSIFYRIIAQDNSSNHNRDSSASIKFAITNIITTNVCRTVWIPIRDNYTNYDSFQIGTHSSISKVNFTMVQLVHTWVGDVTFALRSPSGTDVVLSSSHGGSGDNYINTIFNDSAAIPISAGTPPFTGTFIPDNPLLAFNGQDPFGWWRLRVYDANTGDTGHIDQYCLQIFSGAIIINIGNNEKIPSEYKLYQNYPNPFNPNTVIGYSLSVNSFITLKIYDILGHEIATLVNEIKKAGKYEIQFPNNKYTNNQFSSGVYFYRLTCGDSEASSGQVFTETKKMLLIK